MMDVLLKDYSDKLSKKILKRIRKYHSNIFQLQNNPSYDQEFQEEIREQNSFIHEEADLVTEKQLTNSDPRFKYKNTAYFFYDKFKELVLPIIYEYLDNKNVQIEKVENISNVIYEDEFQVVIKE